MSAPHPALLPPIACSACLGDGEIATCARHSEGHENGLKAGCSPANAPCARCGGRGYLPEEQPSAWLVRNVETSLWTEDAHEAAGELLAELDALDREDARDLATWTRDRIADGDVSGLREHLNTGWIAVARSLALLHPECEALAWAAGVLGRIG